METLSKIGGEVVHQLYDFFSDIRVLILSALLAAALMLHVIRPPLQLRMWWKWRRHRFLLGKFPIMSRWELSAFLQRRIADSTCNEIEELYAQRRIRKKDRRWAYRYLATALDIPDLIPRPTPAQTKARLERERAERKAREKAKAEAQPAIDTTPTGVADIIDLPPRRVRRAKGASK